MNRSTTFLLLSGLGLNAFCITTDKPNIVYIFTDQQTATAMSCAGNKDVNTPNIDRLAAEGVRFTNAYCTAPLCSPSRASMFTGLMPSQAGVTKNGAVIAEKFRNQSLGHVLSANGYECVYAGKWHLPGETIDHAHGFTRLHPFGDNGLSESCVQFLKKKHDKPFFMVASLDNPHNICEYARKQPLPWGNITEPPLENCPNLPSNFYPAPYEPEIVRIEQQKSFSKYPVINYSADEWRRYRNAYYRLVEKVDVEIGKILKAIDDNGLENNTIVILSSDHGDGNASHQWNQKSALFEEVVNIPLIFRVPGSTKKGTVLTQIVNNGPDLFATICDWSKCVQPQHAVGKSLVSLIDFRQEAELHNYIVAETCFDGSTTWGWMIRKPQYKYVLYALGQNREQLFDMSTDKGEQINLAIEARYASVLNQHRELLKEWGKTGMDSFNYKLIP